MNAIISYDVLEHIYDVEDHFSRLRSLQEGLLRIVVYASGANIANPRYVRSVKRKQIDAEYNQARQKKYGHKERDSLQAYLDLRKSIIMNHASDLNPDQVEYLARLTRGLIIKDIKRSVDEFRKNGWITYQPIHPTNTCDPLTGNWCEHLIEFLWLKETLSRQGYYIRITPGYYYSDSSLVKRIIMLLLNILIAVLGKRGMFLAPYYVLNAKLMKNTLHE